MPHNLHNTLQEFKLASGKTGKYYSLPALARALGVNLSRLPVSIRIVLESVLRNCDGKKVEEEHVRQLANWKANAPRTEEIPFVLARIVLQSPPEPFIAQIEAILEAPDELAAELATLDAQATAMNTTIRAVAQSKGWAFADLSALFDAAMTARGTYRAAAELGCASPYGQYISLDGVHPNVVGHQVIAGIVAEAVNATYGFALPTTKPTAVAAAQLCP